MGIGKLTFTSSGMGAYRGNLGNGVTVRIWSNLEPQSLGTKLIPILRQLSGKQLKFHYLGGCIKASALSAFEKIMCWLGLYGNCAVKGLSANVLNSVAVSRILTKATDPSGAGQGGGKTDNIDLSFMDIGIFLPPGLSVMQPDSHEISAKKSLPNQSVLRRLREKLQCQLKKYNRRSWFTTGNFFGIDGIKIAPHPMNCVGMVLTI